MVSDPILINPVLFGPPYLKLLQDIMKDHFKSSQLSQLGPKKIVGPKKFLIQKNGWSEKIFGPKKVFGQKKCLVKKKFR